MRGRREWFCFCDSAAAVTRELWFDEKVLGVRMLLLLLHTAISLRVIAFEFSWVSFLRLRSMDSIFLIPSSSKSSMNTRDLNQEKRQIRG